MARRKQTPDKPPLPPLSQLKGLAGLCVRAGQAVFGEEGCLKALRTGQCGLLLLDPEASAATREKYEDACRNAEARLQPVPPGFLYEATGRPGKAMAVLQGSLSSRMQALISQMEEEAGGSRGTAGDNAQCE